MVGCITLFLTSLLGVTSAFRENIYCMMKYNCHFDNDNMTYVNTLCVAQTWMFYNANEQRTMMAGGVTNILSSLKKTYLLDSHNALRSATAAGKTVGLPPAADMVKLTWDSELEKLAFAWALEGFGGHDVCRTLPPKFPQVGQNIALFGPTTDRILNSSSEEAMALWQKEMTDFAAKGKAIIDRYKRTPETQNVSQILWAATTKMGCSEVAFNRITPGGEDQANWYRFIVCNYGPGITPGKAVYLKGKHCSKCPAGYSCGTDPKYPDLCADNEADFVVHDSSEAGSLLHHGSRTIIFAMMVFIAGDIYSRQNI